MPVRRSFVALLALAGAIACPSSLSPRGNLDGMWEWEFNRNPSGSSITLSLATAGPTVTGTGTICGVGPACSPGSVTITGEHTGGAFQLTIRDQLAFTATYSGQVLSSKELRAIWFHAYAAAPFFFYGK